MQTLYTEHEKTHTQTKYLYTEIMCTQVEFILGTWSAHPQEKKKKSMWKRL